MAITYNALGSTVTVIPIGTVAPGQLNTSVAIVGGYDSSNADSGTTAGEVTVVNTGSGADTAFGADSELAYQSRLAFGNGATEVRGVPVSETQTTESFSSSSSGTLSNTPAFDPNVHPDHDITETNQGHTVNIVYEDPSGTTPDTGTINLYPKTGDWEADTSATYDIQYTYGDYTSAIETAASEAVRAVGVCTEESSLKTKLDTELNTEATNFNMKRGFANADVGLTSFGSYTPATDSWRSVEVAPARGTNTNGEVRTVGAVLGMAASQPINVTGSITFDTVIGFDTLNQDYSPTTAEVADRVTAITGSMEVAEGVTTSTESAFRDIYKVEIIDFIVEQLYQRVKNYHGGSNARSAQRRFKSRLKRSLSSYAPPEAQPPLLASGDGSQPYSVTVTQGSTDTTADVEVGIDVAPIAKQVNLDISVGPIQFNGASV